MTDRHVDDILADFEDLPLPQQMRAAAKVLEATARRFHDEPGHVDRTTWSNEELRTYADAWEAEDRAADAERDAMVEELTLALFHIAQRANHVEASCWAAASATTRLRYLSEARRMYDQGWRKGGSDE